MQLKLEKLANEEKFQAADEMLISSMIRELALAALLAERACLPAWQPCLLNEPACLPGSPAC